MYSLMKNTFLKQKEDQGGRLLLFLHCLSSYYSELPGVSYPVTNIPIGLQGYDDQIYISEPLAEDAERERGGGGVLWLQEAEAAAIDMPSLQQVGGNYMDSTTVVFRSVVINSKKN